MLEVLSEKYGHPVEEMAECVRGEIGNFGWNGGRVEVKPEVRVVAAVPEPAQVPQAPVEVLKTKAGKKVIIKKSG